MLRSLPDTFDSTTTNNAKAKANPPSMDKPQFLFPRIESARARLASCCTRQKVCRTEQQREKKGCTGDRCATNFPRVTTKGSGPASLTMPRPIIFASPPLPPFDRPGWFPRGCSSLDETIRRETSFKAISGIYNAAGSRKLKIYVSCYATVCREECNARKSQKIQPADAIGVSERRC